jgi:hypothetical protein
VFVRSLSSTLVDDVTSCQPLSAALHLVFAVYEDLAQYLVLCLTAVFFAILLFLLILWIVRKKIPVGYKLNGMGKGMTLVGSCLILPYGVFKMGSDVSAAQ